MGRLESKVALITGAGSGFGRATSLLFVKEGAKVVVVDWVAEGGKETVKMIEDSGGEALFVQADVSKTKDVKGMIDKAVGNYGQLDILYNNAGVGGTKGDVTEISEEGWDRSLDIKLKGSWLGMKYGIPEMLKTGGGAVITTSSVSGLVAGPGIAADYNVAMAAVIMLTKSAAVEFADKNIRINCICPGYSATPMLEGAMANKKLLAELNSRQPMNRLGKAEVVAQAALFLADDEASSFITGQALVVDGGQTAKGRGNLVGD